MRQADTVNDTRWVFGYGSLMWRPGFAHTDRQPAHLTGLHRSLCVYSYVHRGTPDRPGLVLGLNHGGACRGVAFKVTDADWPDVVAYLRDREQVTNVYLERVRPIRVGADGDSRVVKALCYVVDRRHEQYAGDLSLETMLDMIPVSTGRSGPNTEYVLNTVAHLEEIGVADTKLYALARRLRDLS